MTDIPTIFKMRLNKISNSKTKYNIKYAVWCKDDILPAFFELIYLPYLIITRN